MLQRILTKQVNKDIELKGLLTAKGNAKGQQDRVEDLRGLGNDLRNLTQLHNKALILQMYSALPASQQAMIFHPLPEEAQRRIILSTNIAETSVTLPDVCFVVDSGLEKRKMFSPSTNMSSLLTQPITKASALQRLGRCGRTRPGLTIRLYTEKSFLQEMEDMNLPEIKSASLSSVILSLLTMGVDVKTFEFIEQPDKAALVQGYLTLVKLKAVDNKVRHAYCRGLRRVGRGFS